MKAILGIIYLIAAIVGILDCVKSQKTSGVKALWILAILFIPYIGVVAYFLIGKKK